MRSLLLSVFFLASTALCARVDYLEDSKSGRGYQLIYEAKTWEDAKSACALKGAKLAAPRSQHEFSKIQSLVRGMKYKSVVGSNASVMLPWLGIKREGDYKVWRNVDGKDIETAGYSNWTKGNGEKTSNPREPHCAALDAVHLGLRSYWCHYRQPFVCEFHLNT